MELTTVFCDIARFKITETIHYNDGIPTRTEFHIRIGKGNIVSRAISNLVEPSKILAWLFVRLLTTYTDATSTSRKG